MSVDEKTREWLAGWGITDLDANDRNLQRLKNGELIEVYGVLDEWPSPYISGCDTVHAKYIDYSLYHRRCRVCERAISTKNLIKVFNGQSVTFCAEVSAVAPKLQEAEQIALQELEEETRKKQEEEEKARIRANESEIERAGRTVVYVNECWECGRWRILGGIHGRMPKDQWSQAMREMKEAFERSFKKIPSGTILSSAPSPEGRGKYYDLLTRHFVFQVTQKEYDGC